MKVNRLASKARSPRKQLDWTPYDYALPIVARRLLVGDFPPPDILAEIVEHNNEELPPWLVQHVCAQLRGEVKRKRGRRPQTAWQRDLLELADWDYRRHLAWLQRRKKSQGLRGWSALRGKRWWQGSPHQRALAMVHELYRRKCREFGSMDVHRFRNLISSRN